MIITAQDLAASKLCRSGSRYFFQRYGFDWSDFVKNGIEAERLASTGDALALKLVKDTEERHGK